MLRVAYSCTTLPADKVRPVPATPFPTRPSPEPVHALTAQLRPPPRFRKRAVVAAGRARARRSTSDLHPRREQDRPLRRRRRRRSHSRSRPAAQAGGINGRGRIVGEGGGPVVRRGEREVGRECRGGVRARDARHPREGSPGRV